MARKTKVKAATIVKVGMAADDLQPLPGRGKSDAIKPPHTVGADRWGLIIEWYYKDCTVTIRRTNVGGIWRYRVAEVIGLN